MSLRKRVGEIHRLLEGGVRLSMLDALSVTAAARRWRDAGAAIEASTLAHGWGCATYTVPPSPCTCGLARVLALLRDVP